MRDSGVGIVYIHELLCIGEKKDEASKQASTIKIEGEKKQILLWWSD